MTDHQSPLPNRKPTAAAPVGRRKPATAYRSAATNDPLTGRANGNTARGRRIRDLYRALISRLGDNPDVVAQADVSEIAELTVACEDLRAGLDAVQLEGQQLKDKANLVNAITRLQSTKERAKRALFKSVPAKPLPRLLQHLHGKKPNA
jgi:lipase chaperone LimK